MIMTAPSDKSVKESTNSWRRYSDLPPSYDAAELEPHSFIDGKATGERPVRAPPEPLVSSGPPSNDLLTTNDTKRDSETTPLFLDPTTGGPRVAYTAPDELLSQCAQYGHVEKTKFGTWGIFAAAMFFPWGLLCLMGSRVVYCERCSLVLRAPRGCKDMHRGHPCGRRRSRYHSGKHRACISSRNL